jgi:S-layer homology domain
VDIKSVVSNNATEGRRRWLIGACIALVVVLALMASVVSLAAASGSTFPDVPASNPYYAAITDLASRGVIGGFPNGNFGPADLVTRQQFAKMVVLAGGYPVSESDVCPFADVVISGPTGLYPDNYVAVCAAHGITTGKTATTFDPYSNITRYQVVSMVVRAADDLHPGLLTAPPSSWTGTPSWQTDPIHGPNAARAEYNGLLAGLSLSSLSAAGYVTRGEVAQVLYNLTRALTPPTTTTTSSTTSTTLVTTTTSSTTTTSTTTTSPDFENLGGSITSGPAAASWAPGRLDVFARGTAGALMHLGYDGQWDLLWQDLGGSLATDSRPAAVASAAHTLDVVVRGTDDALWYKYYSGGAWSAWDREAGTLASAPAAASRGAGTFDVFVRGTTGALLQTTYDSGAWSGTWTNLGGSIKAGSDPAAVSWGPDRIDVFVRGIDDALWLTTWNGASWSAWEKLGGALTSSPTVTSTLEGRLDVFARGANNTIWHRAYSLQTGWAAWEDLGGGAVASAPAAVSWGVDRIDLFVRGGNALWHKWWNGSIWLH